MNKQHLQNYQQQQMQRRLNGLESSQSSKTLLSHRRQTLHFSYAQAPSMRAPNTFLCVAISARSIVTREISDTSISLVSRCVHSARKRRALSSSPELRASWIEVK